MNPQQAVWCGLAFLALQFVAIGSGLREDKTFRHIGACLVVLVAMVGTDLWILIPGLQEGLPGKRLLDASQLSFQALACVFLMILMRFLNYLSGVPGPLAVRLHTALLAPWVLLAAVDAFHPSDLFIGLREGQWQLSSAYRFGFMPHAVAVMAWLTALAFIKRKSSGPTESRTLNRLCHGLAGLFLGGLADFLVLLLVEPEAAPSFTTMGVLGFCLGCTFVLADRMAESYRDRRRSLLEIARVHGELDAEEPLHEIGRSAARVSDAIQSSAADLKGRVETLYRDRTAGQAELERIEKARSRLERLTTAILDFSRCGLIGHREPVDPAALVDAVRDRMPAAGARIRVSPFGGLRPVSVDRPRMEAAVFQLLKNAFEAGAEQVDVRIRQGLGKALFVIEDDGRGVAADAFGDITKPFFTTRKAEGAAGLGAAIAAGTLRAHGGSLRFHPRIGVGGLVASLVLPLEAPSGRQDAADTAPVAACTLLSDESEHVEAFLAVCENLGVRPFLAAGRHRPISGPERGMAAEISTAEGPITEEAMLIRLAGTGTEPVRNGSALTTSAPASGSNGARAWT